MITCPTKAKMARPITEKDQRIFIDRLVEILLMQVETDENKDKYKNENNRIHKNA